MADTDTPRRKAPGRETRDLATDRGQDDISQTGPEERIDLAVRRYLSEEISLAKAAEIAGVSWSQMRTILAEKGISLGLGPETVEEAEGEAQALRDFFL